MKPQISMVATGKCKQACNNGASKCTKANNKWNEWCIMEPRNHEYSLNHCFQNRDQVEPVQPVNLRTRSRVGLIRFGDQHTAAVHRLVQATKAVICRQASQSVAGNRSHVCGLTRLVVLVLHLSYGADDFACFSFAQLYAHFFPFFFIHPNKRPERQLYSFLPFNKTKTNKKFVFLYFSMNYFLAKLGLRQKQIFLRPKWTKKLLWSTQFKKNPSSNGKFYAVFTLWLRGKKQEIKEFCIFITRLSHGHYFI